MNTSSQKRHISKNLSFVISNMPLKFLECLSRQKMISTNNKNMFFRDTTLLCMKYKIKNKQTR